MEFRIAEAADIDRLCAMADQAKRHLRDLGINQWQKGYPSRAAWECDVAAGRAHVALVEGAVQGVFVFVEGEDPSYRSIEGAWLTSGERGYAALHRVCVSDDVRGQGVAGAMFSYAQDISRKRGIGSLRIDTHPDNASMQRALQKAGFSPCGSIRLADGIEKGERRVAFEKLVGDATAAAV